MLYACTTWASWSQPTAKNHTRQKSIVKGANVDLGVRGSEVLSALSIRGASMGSRPHGLHGPDPDNLGNTASEVGTSALCSSKQDSRWSLESHDAADVVLADDGGGIAWR